MRLAYPMRWEPGGWLVTGVRDRAGRYWCAECWLAAGYEPDEAPYWFTDPEDGWPRARKRRYCRVCRRVIALGHGERRFPGEGRP